MVEGPPKDEEGEEKKPLTEQQIAELTRRASKDEKARNTLRRAQKKSVLSRTRNTNRRKDITQARVEENITEDLVSPDTILNLQDENGDVILEQEVTPEDREAAIIERTEALHQKPIKKPKLPPMPNFEVQPNMDETSKQSDGAEGYTKEMPAINAILGRMQEIDAAGMKSTLAEGEDLPDHLKPKE